MLLDKEAIDIYLYNSNKEVENDAKRIYYFIICGEHMGFKIFIIVCNLIIPVIMLFLGVKFRKHGPKNINGIYGYRTSMSMKNKETWEFAHQYCGRLWIKLGLIMLIISIIVSVLAFTYFDRDQGIIDVILVTMQTIALIVSIFPVEKALKNNFDGNGNRRN